MMQHFNTLAIPRMLYIQQYSRCNTMRSIYLIAVILTLSGCAMTDHSRTFKQVVECQGDVTIRTEVLLEKSGSETSEADQTTDAKATVTPI